MEVFVVIIDFKRLQEIKTYAEIKVLFKSPRYFYTEFRKQVL